MADAKYFELVRHPPNVRWVEVMHVANVTPLMRRVTFGGPELAGFISLAPEDHIKVPPETRAIAVLAVGGEEEQQPLAGATPPVVEWVFRSTPAASVAESYRSALARVLPAEGSGFAWLAGEASEVRAAYDELVRARGFDKHASKRLGTGNAASPTTITTRRSHDTSAALKAIRRPYAAGGGPESIDFLELFIPN